MPYKAWSYALQFIYDSWFSQLSPDREFPAEVRWLLNHTFGQFSKRAQRIDWTPLLVRYGAQGQELYNCWASNVRDTGGQQSK